jgi:hypothetical protein
MAARCSKCGEELLGAVNRCWKCGQAFALHPEMDGRPPVRAEAPPDTGRPLDAMVLEPGTKTSAASVGAPPSATIPVAAPRFIPPRRSSTAELVDARRAAMMAMGGTVASIVLGIFAAGLAVVWPPVAVIAILGLAMGIWGLGSPRRNWALIGMLLCCLAIGLGAYGGARDTYRWVQTQRPISVDEPIEAPDEP